MLLPEFIGILTGSLFVFGALMAILIEALLGPKTTIELNLSPSPTEIPEEETETKLMESGTTDLKIIGTSVTGTIEFTKPFSSNPVVLSATLDNAAFLGTPLATLDSFEVTSPTTATVSITLSNFPIALPEDRKAVENCNVWPSCFLDSNGNVWFASKTPTFAIIRSNDGIKAEDFSAEQTFAWILTSSADAHWVETDGNVLVFVSDVGGLNGIRGHYGPPSGTTLSNTIGGFDTDFNSQTGSGPVLDPLDPTHIYLPYYNQADGKMKMQESTDGGRTFGPPSDFFTGNYLSYMVFYDDTNAIILLSTYDGTEVIPIHFDGSTYTERDPIPFAAPYRATLTLVDGTLAAFDVDNNAANNVHVSFATK